MNIAEEQALKAYPKRGWKCKDAEGNDKFLDANRECRLAFVKGYEQAKEEIMKDAIDTRIDKRLADMIGYTGGERVKVIIIKE